MRGLSSRDSSKLQGLSIEHGSVESENPPKPDISCIIEGAKHHFELGEITDQGLASRLAQALREMRITGGFFSQDKPLLNLISQISSPGTRSPALRTSDGFKQSYGPNSKSGQAIRGSRQVDKNAVGGETVINWREVAYKETVW